MRIRVFLAGAIALASVAPLHAQESSPPEGEAIERHELLFREAVEALRLSQYEAASARFEESLRLLPQAKTACNMALTFDRWGGHEAQARDAYVRCAELDTSGRFRDHALARAAALRTVLAERPPDEPDDVEPDLMPDTPPDEAVTRESPLTPPPPPVSPRGLLWAGIGLSVAGFVIVGSAIAPGSSAQDDADTILVKYPDRRIAPDDVQYLGINDDFERKRRIAVGLYVAGGGIAAMGIAFIVADVVRHRRGQSSPVQGAIAPTDGGAMAVGRFEF